MSRGRVENGIVILEIYEALPHTKTKSSELEHWRFLIQDAIKDLVQKYEKPFYEKAHLMLLVEMPPNKYYKAWDISNRAVNLTINNLKGIFFPDDDYEHLSITADGGCAETPKTTIFIGEYHVMLGMPLNTLLNP